MYIPPRRCRFVSMLLGLTNTPGKFQRTIDIILVSVKWQLSFVYFNKTVIFSKTPDKYIDHFKQELTPLQRAGVTLKVRKCFCLTDTIDYLGNVIRRRHLEIVDHAVDAMHKLKQARNITELRSF